MRKTRFMSWFFFLLSLAFLGSRDFRAVMEAPLLSMLPDYMKVLYPDAFGQPGPFGRFWRCYSLERYVSEKDLVRLARDAERRGDARFMAFAALHVTPEKNQEAIFHFADAAVAKDSHLTWIFKDVALRFRDEWGEASLAADLRARLDRFQAWDPNNAVPYLLRGDMVRREFDRAAKAVGSDKGKNVEALKLQLQWQKEMEAALVQPRYEAYVRQGFDLEHRIMRERGWDHPWVVLHGEDLRVPNLWNVRQYILQLLTVGSDAEAAGQTEKALRNYRLAARFSERLRLQGHTLIEYLYAAAFQRMAYDPLRRVLEKAGRWDEAAAVDYASKEVVNDSNRYWMNPSAHSSNYAWSVVLLGVSGALVWVFGLLSLLAIVYVNGKRWVRKEKKGRLYQLMTVGENYAPLTLFLSCLALALTYAPYAQNFNYYLTQEARWYLLDGQSRNSFPISYAMPWGTLPVENPYHGYIALALVAFAVLTMAALFSRWLERRRGLASPSLKSLKT